MAPDWHRLLPYYHPSWAGIWHWLFSMHLGLFWVLALVPLMQRARQKLREARAGGWPSAEAVIQSATVISRNGNLVEVSYRYWAQEYRYGKYGRRFRKKDAAERFAESVRGRTVQVRYREDKPEISVLMERDLELAGALAAS